MPNSGTSVLDALASHRLALPVGATHIRNANTDTKVHRPLSGTAFTVLASHCLTFTDGKETVRGLSPEESAALMSFSVSWKLLPGKQKRKNLLGVGNAVAPCVSRMLTRCLYETEADAPAPLPTPTSALVAGGALPLPLASPSALEAMVVGIVKREMETALVGLKRKLEDLESRVNYVNRV